MDTTINVDNSAQQSSLVSSLQMALMTGSSLAGFTIESTGIQSNMADGLTVKDDSEAIKYRNIAIIVGIVIPIGLSNFKINLSYYLHHVNHPVQERNHLQLCQ